MKSVTQSANFYMYVAMCSNLQVRHNFYAFQHCYCATIREVQCFQFILTTSKMVRCSLIYAALNATRTCGSFCNSQVLVFVALLKSMLCVYLKALKLLRSLVNFFGGMS